MLTAQASVLQGEAGVLPSVSVERRFRVLSDAIIPAERGEFYDYSSEFTVGRPIFALLKCKSNKNRPIEQLWNLGHDANILFQFVDSVGAKAHSVHGLDAASLPGSPYPEGHFVETWLAPVGISRDEFFDIRSSKDSVRLVATCRAACEGCGVSVNLCSGSVIAMMTRHGKFGIFIVDEITPSSVGIEACHILL